MIIRRIGPLSFAKIFGALYFVMGLIFGILISSMSLVIPAMSPTSGRGEDKIFALVFGGLAFIVLPVFYGAMGFIVGLLLAALYNILAKYLGGVEIQIEQKVVHLPEEVSKTADEGV